MRDEEEEEEKKIFEKTCFCQNKESFFFSLLIRRSERERESHRICSIVEWESEKEKVLLERLLSSRLTFRRSCFFVFIAYTLPKSVLPR